MELSVGNGDHRRMKKIVKQDGGWEKKRKLAKNTMDQMGFPKMFNIISCLTPLSNELVCLNLK